MVELLVWSPPITYLIGSCPLCRTMLRLLGHLFRRVLIMVNSQLLSIWRPRVKNLDLLARTLPMKKLRRGQSIKILIKPIRWNQENSLHKTSWSEFALIKPKKPLNSKKWNCKIRERIPPRAWTLKTPNPTNSTTKLNLCRGMAVGPSTNCLRALSQLNKAQIGSVSPASLQENLKTIIMLLECNAEQLLNSKWVC